MLDDDVAQLRRGGRTLWDSITGSHNLTTAQQVQLLEACRMKDRLDRMDAILTGSLDSWIELRLSDDGSETRVVVTSVLDKATTVANTMKQLLAALRLPDEATGKVPQYRGPRGAQAPSVPGGVSSLDRARARKGA